jgi:hypothetical protein
MGRFAEIPIDRLIVEPAAQRYLRQAKVKEIAAAWDWEALRPLTLVPLTSALDREVYKLPENPPTYSIVDGQHSREGCIIANPGFSGVLPSWIMSPRPLSERAFLCLKLNEVQQSHSAADRYFVGLAACIPDVLSTDRILQLKGIKTHYGTSRISKNETRHGHTFMRAYQLMGDRGLVAVIDCVRSCMLDNNCIDPLALKSAFIRGATEYVRQGKRATGPISASQVLDTAQMLWRGRGEL